MSAAATYPYGLSYEEYCEVEETRDTKHEWLDGLVYAMAGGEPEHARLASRLAMIVGALLRGPCSTFSSDLSVKAPTLAAYPDLTVICGKVETVVHYKRRAATNPKVIVEVLSDGTESYDRGDKFAAYRGIPTLDDYVLVNQRERRIEVFSRHSDWAAQTAVSGESISIPSLELVLDVDEVYRDPAVDG